MTKHQSKSFSQKAKEIIGRIPRGKVATYGQIAMLAGNSRGARQVAWLLHSSAEKENLPWFRVVNSKGQISLPRHHGYELQKALLQDEGICFDSEESIDLEISQWRPSRPRGGLPRKR